MTAFEQIGYRGHTINIYRDSDAENPWTAWDGQPPMVVAHAMIHFGHGGYRYETTTYGDLTEDPPDLTDGQIETHYAAILASLIEADVYQEVPAVYPENPDEETMVDITDIVNEAIEEQAGNISHMGDKFEFLAKVWEWAGVSAVVTSTSGCSQSDYAELLLVATPEFLKSAGRTEYTAEELKADAIIYGYYAWGDVFGYQVEGPLCDDSCWGFYGDNHEDSGLMQSAKEAIDFAVKAELEAIEFMKYAWAC